MATATILIVDDEIIIARELESRLTNLGYEVPGIAASGKEAIRLVEATDPDLVLMDIVLKGDMDGIEAAAKIRQRRSVPVIYLTAYTDETTLQRARITEPFAYVVKPFSERELRANIEMALYKHAVEGRLRKVEKWFAASMERVAEGVIATDSQGVVAFLNREAEALTGWKSAEAVGRTAPEVLALVSQAARTPVEGVIRRALAEGIVTYLGDEILLLNRAGEAVPVAVTASCVRGGGGDRLVVVIVLRDLSEQRQVQQALRESEERFRLLVEQVKDYAIFMLDPEGRVISWNSGAERIKGYRAEEIVGQHFSRFHTTEAVERGWPQHELEAAEAEGRFEDEGWRVRKGGSRYWANVVISALRDESGNLRGFSKIVRDLTERKQAEEELREKNEAWSKPTGARMRSWRCWPTNSVIPWPRSATACTSWASGGVRTRPSGKTGR